MGFREPCPFGYRDKRYYTIKTANNKSGDQTLLFAYSINSFPHDVAQIVCVRIAKLC